MIVVDMTVLAPFLLRTSTFSSAARVSRKDSLWIVPPEWRLELLSELVHHVRTGRANVQEAHTLLAAAEFLVRFSHEMFDDLTILTSAVDFQLSAAEVSYVLTARRLGTKLVTDRTSILATCPDVAVSLETFGAV